jgi:hypothetical protein
MNEHYSFFQLTRFVVEEDCFSDPLYTKLCHPFCDPSELKDIRRCFDIHMIYQEFSLDITILDVIEMLDGNMQVLPQKYNIVRVPSVLHGAPIPSSKIIYSILYSSHHKKTVTLFDWRKSAGFHVRKVGVMYWWFSSLEWTICVLFIIRFIYNGNRFYDWDMTYIV